MENYRIIRVTGKGIIKVKPDMTRLKITLEKICKEYSDALRSSAKDTEQLKEVLAAFGFVSSDLKTLIFNVDTEYERYETKSGYSSRLIGYKYRHVMKLEFDSDNERLGKILYALANCSLRPEFRISYTIRNRETAKNELLGKAITDAKAKAAVLTQAAGVGLEEIQSIDYSWGEIDFEVHPMNEAMLLESTMAGPLEEACYNLDIEPDDIEVSDTVTVIWKIK